MSAIRQVLIYLLIKLIWNYRWTIGNLKVKCVFLEPLGKHTMQKKSTVYEQIFLNTFKPLVSQTGSPTPNPMIDWVSWCQATPNKQSNDESFTEPFTVFKLFGGINLLCEWPTVQNLHLFFTLLWDKRKYFII